MSHAWEPGLTRYLPTDREPRCKCCGQPDAVTQDALDQCSTEAIEHGDIVCEECGICVACGRWVERGLERRKDPTCERCQEEPEP